MKRVVVTGIGAVTPLGNSLPASWTSALTERSGLAPITKFDTSGLRWKIAGEVKAFDPGLYFNSKELRRLDLFIHYAVAASIEALEDAGIAGPSDDNEHREAYLGSGGVIIGSSRGGIASIETAIIERQWPLSGNRPRKLSAYLMPATTIGMASSYIAQRVGIKGYCLGISNACASGTNAIGEAYRLIRAGYKGPLLAGGSEAPICKLCLEGYGASGALSSGTDLSASRPFDTARDGFVISEGAVVLVLEALDTALARNAGIYGEIIGYANTVDAFHQTRPDRGGKVRAMEMALSEAGITSKEVDYISAHGTSTVLGDRVEADAIREVFGRVPVAAIKSMTGHMLAASGPLEAAFTLMSMQEKRFPPTLNIHEQDRCCDINLITKKTAMNIDIAVANSFGFGGVNAVLVLKRLSTLRNRTASV